MMTSTRMWRSALRENFARVGALLLAGTVLAACDSRTPTATYPDASALVASMTLSPKALMMAVNDTVTLTPSLYALDGTPITDVSGVTYQSLAPNQLTVSSDGLVKAIGSSDVVLMIAASLQRNQNTVVDTVRVYVTPTRETVSQFVMEPDPDDGSTIGVNYSTWINAYLVTAANDTIFDVPVSYTTSSPQAFVNVYGINAYFGSRAFGNVKAYGSTMVYGVTYTDSLEYTITYPDEAYFVWNSGHWYYPPALQVVLKPGGYVYWSNFGSETSNPVVFDDPSAAEPYEDGEGGNIPAFSGTRYFRKFSRPGTYKWHSGDDTGTIIVMPTDAPPAS